MLIVCSSTWLMQDFVSNLVPRGSISTTIMELVPKRPSLMVLGASLFPNGSTYGASGIVLKVANKRMR